MMNLLPNSKRPISPLRPIMKHFFMTLTLLITFSFCLSFVTESNATDRGEYPNQSLLVETSELSELMRNSDTILIDMRAEGYTDGHIPGALWFGGITALVNGEHEVEHYLVDAADFQQLMRTVGVNQDSHILIYDDGNGLGASRLFYALNLYGHENSAVVNGGFAAWAAEGYPVETDGDIPAPGNFSAEVNEARFCDVSFLTQNLERDDIVILDARSPEEFSGEEQRSSRSGHIPGAVNLEWRNFVQIGEDVPYFKSADEIASLLEEKGITPDKEVITHCQTNVRGSHAFFTLRLMGYDSVRAYEGSWFEWGNREDTPVSGE